MVTLVAQLQVGKGEKSLAKSKVGIVGANVNVGWGASVHIPALRALPEYEIAAVATTRIETAQETATKFGIPRAYGNAHELFADKDIDLVSICVRVPHHFELVKAALEHGKDIYCEWPLTVTTEQALILKNLAEKKGVRTAIGLQARADAVLRYVKHLIEQGSIGKVQAVSLVYSSAWPVEVIDNYAPMQDAQSGLSQLELSAGHSLDLLSWLLAEIDWLQAAMWTHVPTAKVVDTGREVRRTSADQIVVQGQLTTGATLSAYIGGAPGAGTGSRIELQGEQGTLLLTSSPGMSRQPIQTADLTVDHYVGGRPTRLTLPAEFILVPEAPSGVARDPGAKGADVAAGPSRNVAGMYRSFAIARTENRRFEPDFALALRRHQMLDAIRQSAATSQRVVFKPTA